MSTVQKQLVRSDAKQEEVTWSSVFPTDVSTEEQSLIFVKKLLAVAMSSITYLRIIFPETSYKDKIVEGLNLKILMDQSGSEGANKLISWIYGCFDAIEKRYLREMTLAIHTDIENPQAVIETYSFKFTYSENGEVQITQVNGTTSNQKEVTQKYEVKKPTLKMIRTIILLMQSLEPLPAKVYLSMKLHYFEELTPVDYEPQGFCPGSDVPFNFENDAVNLKVGQVKTAFHSIKLRLATDNSQFVMKETTEVFNKEKDHNDSRLENGKLPECSHMSLSGKLKSPVEISLVRSRKFRHRFCGIPVPSIPKYNDLVRSASSSEFVVGAEHTPDVSPRSKINEDSQLVPGTPLIQHQTHIDSDVQDNHSNSSSACSMRSVSLDIAPSNSKDYPVRCPCDVYADDGLMMLCDVCGYWQHGACFTVLDESLAPAKHYCDHCADPPSLCTDPRLCFGDPVQVKATCLYRRALVAARHLKGRVSSIAIGHRLGVDISASSKVVEKLILDKILVSSDTGSGAKKVDIDVLLNVAYPKYFNQTRNRTPEKKTVALCSIGKEEELTPNSVSLIGAPESQIDSQMSIDVVNDSFDRTSIKENVEGNSPDFRDQTPEKDDWSNSENHNLCSKVKKACGKIGEKSSLKKCTKLSRGKRKLLVEQMGFDHPNEVLSSMDCGLVSPPLKKDKVSDTKHIRV